MKILSLDTSTRRENVALLEDRDLVAELRIRSAGTHSAHLLASIEFVLKSAGWRLQDLELVAAGIGPGSFTGIRIGVATAMGLAQTLMVPFAGISGLDALAHAASFVDGRIGVMLDAQRSQVYYAEYAPGRGRLRRVVQPVLMEPGELSSGTEIAGLYLLGDGAERYRTVFGASGTGWPRLIPGKHFPAPWIGRLALSRRSAWRSGAYIQSEPLYIRPPDALRRKVKKKT